MLLKPGVREEGAERTPAVHVDVDEWWSAGGTGAWREWASPWGMAPGGLHSGTYRPRCILSATPSGEHTSGSTLGITPSAAPRQRRLHPAALRVGCAARNSARGDDAISGGKGFEKSSNRQPNSVRTDGVSHHEYLPPHPLGPIPWTYAPSAGYTNPVAGHWKKGEIWEQESLISLVIYQGKAWSDMDLCLPLLWLVLSQ
ncbi:hypothetical protein JB92DRAFT_2829829 [Gautieria morchelliformis]|nr:hypothetical protein JB92DRAFT_2829829 [Gautieria morchelliformis]